MTVVFGTNVLISAALAAKSVPSIAVRNAAQTDIILVSAATLSELASTIERSKFDRYASREDRRTFVTFIHAMAKIVPIRRFMKVRRDPTDDKFLDVAVNGRAAVLVSGDNDLLTIGSIEGMPIVTPAD